MDNLRQRVNDIIVKINRNNLSIKYCVYRTALKLSEVQESFQLARVSSSSIFNAIKDYCDVNNDFLPSVSSQMLSMRELNEVVHKVVESSELEFSLEISKLVSTLIFETYHDAQETNVAMNAVVLFFIVMGSDSLQLKYQHLFDLYAAPLGTLTRSRTGLLLSHLLRLTDLVGESTSFGKINPSVLSCFDGVLGNMISQQHFLRWMFQEPQSIVWLPTMHRINLAKSSVHDVECATCKVRPIVGLRFQCLKCFDYNSCQVCFLTQQNLSRLHKLHHPRQEYCLPAGGKEKLNAFARTIRNIVTKRYKQKSSTPSYLPISQNQNDVEQDESVHMEDHVVKGRADFGDLSHLAEEERKRLKKIVNKLKSENKKISGTVHLLESSKTEDGADDGNVLQNRLDTAMLHNQSLQAELDNLKCVVFAENFLSSNHVSELPGNQLFIDGSVSGSNHEEEKVVTPEMSSPKSSKRRSRRKKRSVSSVEDMTPLSPEQRLLQLVNELQAAVLGAEGNGAPILYEVCKVAVEAKHRINELVDQAILIQ